MITRKTRKCRLCGAELTADNKCDSHIIPRFIWREYMEENSERQEAVLLGPERPRILRKCGVTDDNILCRKCDGDILGEYENNFKKVWERVFKNGELCPLNHNGHLIGWTKKIDGREDIIKTKLFMLCCLWRASISSDGKHKLKLNSRKEVAIQRELQRKNHSNLLYKYSTLCSRYEDGDIDAIIDPYCIRKNPLKTSLCYLHLPGGFTFIMRLGTKSISKNLEVCEFGASKRDLFILNAGKMEGSKMEGVLLRRTLAGLQDMYESDKKNIKGKLVSKYKDLSQEDVDDVF